MTDSTNLANRAAVIAGLGLLRQFIVDHPELPLSTYSTGVMQYHSHADTDAGQRAEVDRIAAILEVEPVETAHGGHYEAERRFGPGVFYRAVAIGRDHMARYAAHMKPYHEAEEALAAQDGPVSA